MRDDTRFDGVIVVRELSAATAGVMDNMAGSDAAPAISPVAISTERRRRRLWGVAGARDGEVISLR